MINATGFTPVYYHTDYWDLNTPGLLIRRHRRPRKVLFTPLKVAGLPIPESKVGRRRTTYFEFEDGTTTTRVDDDWTDPAVSQLITDRYYKGYTTFTINSDNPTGKRLVKKTVTGTPTISLATPPTTTPPHATAINVSLYKYQLNLTTIHHPHPLLLFQLDLLLLFHNHSTTHNNISYVLELQSLLRLFGSNS